MKGEARKLGGAVLVYGLGEVLGRFVNFLLLPLYTSYLTPADYGVAAILGVVTFLIRPLFSLGLETAMGIEYFQSEERRARATVVWTAFTMLVAAAAVMLLAGWLLSDSVSRLAFHGDPQYGRLVAIAIAGSAANIAVQPLMQAVQFERKATLYVVLTTVSTAISIGLSVLMVVGLHRGVAGWVEADMLGRIVTLLMFAIPVLPRLAPVVRGAVGRQLLRLGLPLVPGFAFVFVLQQGNKYILQWIDGLSMVGIYNIGFNLGVAALGMPVAAFQRAWTPYFMEFVDRPADAAVVFRHVLTYYVFLFGGLSIAVMLVARPLIMVLTQPAFHSAYLVLGFSALAQCLYGMFYVLLPGAYFAKDVRFVTIMQALAALITVVANVILIRWLGLIGAGVGLVVGAVAQAALQHLRNVIVGHLPVRYEWGRISGIGLAYVAYAFVALWPRHFPLGLEIGISSVAGATLIPLFLLMLHPQEREWLWRQASRLRSARGVAGA